MNRRSFLTTILAGSIAPMFLPGAGRIWVPEKRVIGYALPYYMHLSSSMGTGYVKLYNKKQLKKALNNMDVFFSVHQIDDTVKPNEVNFPDKSERVVEIVVLGTYMDHSGKTYGHRGSTYVRENNDLFYGVTNSKSIDDFLNRRG